MHRIRIVPLVLCTLAIALAAPVNAARRNAASPAPVAVVTVVTKKVERAAHRVGRTMSRGAHKVEGKVSRAAHATSRTMKRAVHATSKKAKRVAHKVETKVRAKSAAVKARMKKMFGTKPRRSRAERIA